MILIVLFITFFYCIVIGSFIIGFDRIEEFKATNDNHENSFSIVIPFRDEEEALPLLLKSLKELNYPLDQFEILFIDDDSSDKSVELINKFFADAQNNIKIINPIRKSLSPKKDAIETAIQRAKFDWIITTDADCIVPKNWLHVFSSIIEKKKMQFIVAPVTYNSNNTFLAQFQLLDFLSLQGTTIGAFGIRKPFLCNGVNLCYNKEIFNAVSGFEGNSAIASGDDIFLLEKVLTADSEKVTYLKSKNVIVRSRPEPTFKLLLQQRIRWGR